MVYFNNHNVMKNCKLNFSNTCVTFSINLFKDLKSELLINLLAGKLRNISSYIIKENLKSYEKIKNLVHQ